MKAGYALGIGVPIIRSSSKLSDDLPPTIKHALTVPAAGGDLGAVEHVVFLMQENRSFDHYFGSYRGVRGFDDHPTQSLGIFAQPDPSNTTRTPVHVQLPFHLDTSLGVGQQFRDLNHDWLTQHTVFDGGAMDRFVTTHSSPKFDGPDYGLLTMSYYNRIDIPYHYALADAFTICDNYHSSVLGPTGPNRLMAISGTIDPEGKYGGPIIATSTSASTNFSVDWTTIPELLEDAGVSWKTYSPAGQGFQLNNPSASSGNSILQYFKQYSDPRSTLYKKAFLPTYPRDFFTDISANTLPSVSWINSPAGFDEHPPASPNNGAWFIDQVLQALTSNPKVWSRTVLFICYDESDGLFDHVAPPTPPEQTLGEYISANPLPNEAKGVAGPIGLGFRVPMLVVSPFSTGGYVCSQLFDHTSQLQFLEERFGIHVANISAWRRQIVGDLTSTLHTSTPQVSIPRLPATAQYSSQNIVEGTTTGGAVSGQNQFQLAAVQTMASQEVGSARRLPIQDSKALVTIWSFARGSAVLSSSLERQVVTLAQLIRKKRYMRIKIIGYADDELSPTKSRSLSEKRAKAVATYLDLELSKLGYRQATIIPIGAGTSSPVAASSTAFGQARNRRVLAVAS